jgi:hypothetical protein
LARVISGQPECASSAPLLLYGGARSTGALHQIVGRDLTQRRVLPITREAEPGRAVDRHHRWRRR